MLARLKEGRTGWKTMAGQSKPLLAALRWKVQGGVVVKKGHNYANIPNMPQ